MHFSVLGPLRVRGPDGTAVELSSPKLRTLLRQEEDTAAPRPPLGELRRLRRL